MPAHMAIAIVTVVALAGISAWAHYFRPGRHHRTGCNNRNCPCRRPPARTYANRYPVRSSHGRDL